MQIRTSVYYSKSNWVPMGWDHAKTTNALSNYLSRLTITLPSLLVPTPVTLTASNSLSLSRRPQLVHCSVTVCLFSIALTNSSPLWRNPLPYTNQPRPTPDPLSHQSLQIITLTHCLATAGAAPLLARGWSNWAATPPPFYNPYLTNSPHPILTPGMVPSRTRHAPVQ